MAKHTMVRATRDTKCGATIRALCARGSGFWNRLRESCSIGPMRISDRVVLRAGFSIVPVAWLYRVMGEKLETISRVRSLLSTAAASVDAPGGIGEIASAASVAPRAMKNARNIQRASEARAEVAMPRN